LEEEEKCNVERAADLLLMIFIIRHSNHAKQNLTMMNEKNNQVMRFNKARDPVVVADTFILYGQFP
jgi:hypothetical protein